MSLFLTSDLYRCVLSEKCWPNVCGEAMWPKNPSPSPNEPEQQFVCLFCLCDLSLFPQDSGTCVIPTQLEKKQLTFIRWHTHIHKPQFLMNMNTWQVMLELCCTQSKDTFAWEDILLTYMNFLESCQSLTLVMDQSLHLEMNDFCVDETMPAQKPTHEVLTV